MQTEHLIMTFHYPPELNPFNAFHFEVALW